MLRAWFEHFRRNAISPRAGVFGAWFVLLGLIVASGAAANAAVLFLQDSDDWLFAGLLSLILALELAGLPLVVDGFSSPHLPNLVRVYVTTAVVLMVGWSWLRWPEIMLVGANVTLSFPYVQIFIKSRRLRG